MRRAVRFGAPPFALEGDMKAIVTQAFHGCLDGDRAVRPFRPGDQIEGDLARAMVSAGKARDIADSGRKARGGAPENKDLGGAPEDRFRDGAGAGDHSAVAGRDGGDRGAGAVADAGGRGPGGGRKGKGKRS